MENSTENLEKSKEKETKNGEHHRTYALCGRAEPAPRCPMRGMRWGSVPAYPHLSALRKEETMTLQELSRCYEEAAVPLRNRLRELRQALAESSDPEEIWHIKRRIGELTPMLTQMNELADLTAHYYDRGYWRSEKYTL
jgi:hypothetical protein